MSDGSETPVLKRKRITMACHSCRSKKVKCDGKRPICGRCAGYTYHCTWPTTGRGESQSDSPPQAASTATISREAAQEKFKEYQQLVYSICAPLHEGILKEIHDSLAFIQVHVYAQLGCEVETCGPTSDGTLSEAQKLWNKGYLGETSDVRFVNFVKEIVSPESGGGDSLDPPEDPDNYDPEQLISLRRLPNPLAFMPARSTAVEYLDNYFTTIHIAYPFVERRVFTTNFETLHTSGLDEQLSHSWLSLLYALLAIGAYYHSFHPGRPSADPSHRSLFHRSVVLSELNTSERSVTQLSALLGQCFYLLATSEIEKCWTLLGRAIRLGQSIGLHVNIEDSKLYHIDAPSEAKQSEAVSRVWYSLYILDRLLALQLGRPPAISDEYCHVSIPDRHMEFDVGFGNNNEEERLYVSQYFVSMIEFSSIVGRILREVYHPQRELATKLNMVAQHCKLLVNWKTKLPRNLRFDLGHAFENSMVLKRQRNMLAIKYHHLQTLIHRPFLCYPHLKSHSEQPVLSPDQYNLIKQYGQMCEQEARAIIHLIHNVTDAEDVVMNYPWWQMISCLVCAESVLITAQACARQEQNGSVELREIDLLSEDIEICMQIMNQLSLYSHGAKRAYDMMKNIRERSVSIRGNPMSAVAAATMVAGGSISEGGDLNTQQLYNTDDPSFGFNISPAILTEWSGADFSMGSWDLGVGFS
ncbi:fungal-specific transcription factor domain-containing protein [Xylariaceae sp. FL0255]|nr:fungal-specific transcription factor domain-containing protein [Xylariaceae sp. FL0255]